MSEENDSADVENRPSQLDDTTHQELSTLYREATQNMLFAKAQQWRTVVYTTFVFAAIVAVGFWKPGDTRLADFLLGAIFVVTVGALLLLVMYQVWQAGEQRRLTYIAAHFSSFFNLARNKKSPLTGEIHRYAILFGLMLFVILAAIITLRIFWGATP